jgi:hypothetical protein
MTSATSGSASIDINATPERVYEIISDVTTIGERSPESTGAEWLAGDGGRAAVGARFKGHNRLGLLRWTTECEVTAATPGREFAFDVVHRSGRVETSWRYLIEALGDGCRLTETYEFQWCPIAYRLAEIPFPRDRQLRRGITETIRQVKATAESS